MKTKEELKQELYKLIDSIDDEHILNVLNEDIVPYVIENRTKEMDEAGDDLSEEQLQRLDAAVRQAEEGKTITLDEFNRRMAGWRIK